MKKRVALLLVVLMVFSAFVWAGCGKADNTADKGQGETPKATFPQNPVKILVGHGAGGSTDAVIRVLQPYLQKHLNTPIVVENVTGAGGMIAAKQAAAANPDGYTLFAMVNPTYVILETVQGNTPAFRDFKYIANVAGKESNGIAVSAKSDLKTIDDLINLAKKRQVIYSATSGISNSTLGYAFLADKTGIKFKHLPYESGTDAIMAVVGGHADITISSMMSMRPLIKSGEVRLLTYFSNEKDPNYPDVQRFGEKYPGSGYETSIGLIAPPNTPDDVVSILQDAMKKATEDPEFLEKAKPVFSVDAKIGEDFKKDVLGLYDYSEKMKPVIESTVPKKK